LYKASKDKFSDDNEKVAGEQTQKWVYVGYVRAHSHDVKALTMAVPVCKEGLC
jgi:U3 small nucleolar RNA-associated protein 4